MTKNPFLNALAATAYIVAIASFMFYAGKTLPKEDTFLTPIVVLSLLTLSAAVMAYIFGYQPFQLYFNNKKKQAIDLFLKTVLTFGVATLLLIVLLFSGVNLFQEKETSQETAKSTATSCVGDECLQIENLDYPTGTLPEEITNALTKALDDEYKAQATYDAVLKKFGNVRPFIMIVRAEEQHIAALKSIFDKYGVSIPENSYVNVSVPKTIQQACQTGVDAEIENVRLYKENLLPVVSDYSDITSVFTNLMNASETKHLPAFERCN